MMGMDDDDDDDAPDPALLRCATIFSASNYGGSGRNHGRDRSAPSPSATLHHPRVWCFRVVCLI